MAGDDDVERLGDLLIEEGIITYEEAADSVKATGQSNTVLGRLLIQSNSVRRKELASFLAMDAEIPYIDLDKVDVQPHDPPYIPEGIARKHECVPLGRIQNILIVAKANVMNRAAVIDIRKMTGLKVKVFRGDEEKVLAALDKAYKPVSRKAAEAGSRRTATTGRAIRIGEPPAPSGPLQAIALRTDELGASPIEAEARKIAAAWDKLYASAHPIPAERVA